METIINQLKPHDYLRNHNKVNETKKSVINVTTVNKWIDNHTL
jgi:hypothetical protein